MQTIIYRMHKQQDLTVQHCIQYPVINHNGKEYEKEYIYMCVCVYICITE